MTHNEPFSWLQMTNMISYQGLVRTFPNFINHSDNPTLPPVDYKTYNALH